MSDISINSRAGASDKPYSYYLWWDQSTLRKATNVVLIEVVVIAYAHHIIGGILGEFKKKDKKGRIQNMTDGLSGDRGIKRKTNPLLVFCCGKNPKSYPAVVATATMAKSAARNPKFILKHRQASTREDKISKS